MQFIQFNKFISCIFYSNWIIWWPILMTMVLLLLLYLIYNLFRVIYCNKICIINDFFYLTDRCRAKYFSCKFYCSRSIKRNELMKDFEHKIFYQFNTPFLFSEEWNITRPHLSKFREERLTRTQNKFAWFYRFWN